MACLCPFGASYPLDTSRRPKDSEREGQGYSFVSRAEMEADIRAGRYLEHGEYEGNLYGTRIDSIRGVVAAGRVCVLDVNPQVLPGPLLPSLLSGGLILLAPQHFSVYFQALPYKPSATARDPGHLEPLSPASWNPHSSVSSHLPALLPFVPGAHVPEPQAPHSPLFLGTCPHRYHPRGTREYTPDPPLLQAVKVLRTAEFVPYVVFIEAPDFETLRAMNRAALESGVSTKQLTVRASEVRWEGCLRSGKGPPPNSWQPRAPHCSSASRTNDSY